MSKQLIFKKILVEVINEYVLPKINTRKSSAGKSFIENRLRPGNFR